MNRTPGPGRIVHYVLPNTARLGGELRPAIIVRVFPEGDVVNLDVFMDGDNDGDQHRDHAVMNVQSVAFNKDGTPGTWNWPPKL